jgi:hypothetical protein
MVRKFCMQHVNKTIPSSVAAAAITQHTMSVEFSQHSHLVYVPFDKEIVYLNPVPTTF